MIQDHAIHISSAIRNDVFHNGLLILIIINDYFRLAGTDADGFLQVALSGINPMNAKRVREEILKVLDEYIPGVAELMTKTKALKKAEKELLGEIAVLKKEANASKPSVQRLLELERKVQEQEELQRTIASLQQTLTAIPPEILAEYSEPKSEGKEQKIHEAL